MQHKQEQELIRKIKHSGNRTAADTLIRYYYDEIHRFVCKQTANSDTALDLTQEVFISVLKTINRYDPDKGAGFRTWLYKIATDKVIDYFRSSASLKNKMFTLSLDDTLPIDQNDFTLAIENKEFARQVRDFVNALPADTQKIFRLHIFGGYTFAEIAKETALPESSVKSRYYRLLKTLRKEFEGYGT